MPVDFAALARSIRAVPGVRVCLVVSREGLTLAVSPEELENEAVAAWSRMAVLGDVEKGFVSMGGEQWVFSRRGPYGALALGDPTARPGVVLAQLDQVLLAADEDRVWGREEIRATPPSRPSGQPDPQQAARFRAPLHRAPAPTPPTPAPAPASTPAPAVSTPAPAPPTARPPQGPDAPGEKAPPASTPAKKPSPSQKSDEDWSVDVVEISREFGGLYGESGAEKPEWGEE